MLESLSASSTSAAINSSRWRESHQSSCNCLARRERSKNKGPVRVVSHATWYIVPRNLDFRMRPMG